MYDTAVMSVPSSEVSALSATESLAQRLIALLEEVLKHEQPSQPLAVPTKRGRGRPAQVRLTHLWLVLLLGLLRQAKQDRGELGQHAAALRLLIARVQGRELD